MTELLCSSITELSSQYPGGFTALAPSLSFYFLITADSLGFHGTQMSF